jgi:hypothetical protein
LGFEGFRSGFKVYVSGASHHKEGDEEEQANQTIDATQGPLRVFEEDASDHTQKKALHRKSAHHISTFSKAHSFVGLGGASWFVWSTNGSA